MTTQLGKVTKNGNGRARVQADHGGDASADICSCLGLSNDADTSFGYPNPANACYAVEPVCQVRLEHQEAFCLSGKYVACSLYHHYARPENGNRNITPEALQRALQLDGSARPWLKPVLVLGGFILLVAMAFGLSQRLVAVLATPSEDSSSMVSFGSPSPAPTLFGLLATPTGAPFYPFLAPGDALQAPATPTPFLLASPTPEIAVVATQVISEAQPQATETQAPSTTPAPDEASPTTDPALCNPPDSWLLYTVQPGDGLYALSKAVGTSMQALMDANCLDMSGTLYVGQRLYVPRLPAPTQPPAATATQSPEPTEEPTHMPPTATPTEIPTRQLPTQTPTLSPPTDTPETSTPLPTPTLAPTVSAPTEEPTQQPTLEPAPTGTP